MATPFAAGVVDSAAIARNVERWVAAGVGGIVALGTNGEAPLLDEDESDRVIAAARDALPSTLLLIAGTGRESTPATVAASRRAGRLGADGVLVRTPSYYKTRMTPAALVRHYRAVADESPVPVLLYNYPAVTGVNLASETVATLAAHPNIIGIKETGTDTAQVAAFVDSTPAAFSIIAGSAPTFYASLCMGASGGILAVACVVPDLCLRVLEHFRMGRHREARDLQGQLTPLARLVTTTFGVPGLKAAMDLAGFAGGDPRPPLEPAAPDAIDQIRLELARLRAVLV
jgi:4-hydroxy-2-oxoglutarate aldolase